MVKAQTILMDVSQSTSFFFLWPAAIKYLVIKLTFFCLNWQKFTEFAEYLIDFASFGSFFTYLNLYYMHYIFKSAS